MFWTAFLLGISGSLHCAGMCSPLVMAVTSQKSFWVKIIYNSGRILSYGILGMIAAQLGQFAFLHSYQAIVSIVLGAALLLFAFGLIPGLTLSFVTKPINVFTGFLKHAFKAILAKKSIVSTFVLGILNGFIPCGISSLALAYCLILPDATAGFLAMIVFGLGTWPVMVFLPWIAGWVGEFSTRNFHKATLAAMFLSGILLMGQGVWSGLHPRAVSSTEVSAADILICP